MKKALAGLMMLGLLACGPAPAPVETKATTAPAPKRVPDHTSVLPDEHKISTQVVPDHILGIQAIPGGSLGDYEDKGKKYEIFIIDADSNQNAAFMMLDVKAQMKDTSYIAYIGGYFGTYQDKPLYVYSKGHYVAGVWGLPRAQADKISIALAANLH